MGIDIYLNLLNLLKLILRLPHQLINFENEIDYQKQLANLYFLSFRYSRNHHYSLLFRSSLNQGNLYKYYYKCLNNIWYFNHNS